IIATLLGTFSSLLITFIVMTITSDNGLHYEEMQFLTRPYRLVFLAGLFIGSLGAVMDVAITMSSAIFELYEKNNHISIKALKTSAFDIGKDIMGTMTNILFFAYISGSMPMLILYLKNYSPLGFTLSMNLSLELARALAGGIGIVLTIPIGLYFSLLSIILFMLMIGIGVKKGARSFISLFLNFLVVLLTVWIMTDPHANPIILTIIACTIVSSINLFYINQVNSKTITAFIASLITIIILISFIYMMTKKAMIQGFGEEEIDEISIFSLYLGIDFVKVGAAVIIMSTIGAITDVAISITSPMREVFRHHPDISQKELFVSGLNVGR